MHGSIVQPANSLPTNTHTLTLKVIPPTLTNQAVAVAQRHALLQVYVPYRAKAVANQAKATKSLGARRPKAVQAQRLQGTNPRYVTPTPSSVACLANSRNVHRCSICWRVHD
jgi:hypothetical protein